MSQQQQQNRSESSISLATQDSNRTISTSADTNKIVNDTWKKQEPLKAERRTTSLFEIVLYAFCLIIICIISFGRTSSSMYYFTNMLMNAFVTSTTANANAFYDIAQNNGADFWQALQGPIFSRLYNIDTAKSEYGYVYRENKVLGVARLRQVRIKPNSCKLHKEFVKRNFTQGCYAAYTIHQEDQMPFGDGTRIFLTSDAWHYVSAEKIKTSSHSGVVSTYGGGGYVQLFTRNAKMTMEILRELERNSWIDRGTRAIFFDIIIYNPNVNLFCHIRLLAEYPSSGGAIASASVRTVKLIRYTSLLDYGILVCELTFIIVVILQIIDVVAEIVRGKLSFFVNLWNWLNLISIGLSIVCIIFELLVHTTINKNLGDLLQIQTNYPDFDRLFSLQLNSNFYLGITLGIIWLKIFKYLNINKTLILLNATLWHCTRDLFAFACIFFIVFIAYTQLGWLLFGAQLAEWRSFQISTFTLFRMILGDFDLYAMIDVGAIIGPMFFFTYIFFVYFVLLNMFLAIINETYARVQDDRSMQLLKIEIGHFSKGYDRLLRTFHLRQKNMIDVESPTMTLDELKEILKVQEYTDTKIEEIFRQYDKNQDGILDNEELLQINEDFEKQGIKIKRDTKEPVDKEKKDENQQPDMTQRLSYNEYLALATRVDEIETKTDDLVGEIDRMFVKLDTLDKTNMKRDEVLTRIFGNS